MQNLSQLSPATKLKSSDNATFKYNRNKKDFLKRMFATKFFEHFIEERVFIFLRKKTELYSRKEVIVFVFFSSKVYGIVMFLIWKIIHIRESFFLNISCVTYLYRKGLRLLYYKIMKKFRSIYDVINLNESLLKMYLYFNKFTPK